MAVAAQTVCLRCAACGPLQAPAVGPALWSDDNWWIKRITAGAEDDAGFNRNQQGDYGCRRHSGKAKYAFADGHVRTLNANDTPCNENECWWSIQPDAHRRSAP